MFPLARSLSKLEQKEKIVLGRGQFRHSAKGRGGAPLLTGAGVRGGGQYPAFPLLRPKSPPLTAGPTCQEEGEQADVFKAIPLRRLEALLLLGKDTGP